MSDFEQIERDTAIEREKFAQSLNALSATLAPENVKKHAAGLAQAYGGDLGQQAFSAAKQNPAAFALVGAGLSLLLTGTGSRPAARAPVAAAVAPDEALTGFDARVAAADTQIKEEMTGRLKQKDVPSASFLRTRLNDGLDALPDASRKRVLAARKAVLDVQEQIEAKARRASKKSQTFMHDQPLAVGAITLGIGALIGALLPSTRREDALMGARRDAVMAMAQSTLQDELAKVQTSKVN